MSSMLPTLSFTFIEAGASLVGQRAALPVGAGAWPRCAGTVRVRRARAGPDAVAPGSSCRAGGAGLLLRPLLHAGVGHARCGVWRDERRRGREEAACAGVNLRRQQVRAGCFALLKIQARTAERREIDGVVRVAARHLGTEVVEVLREGHTA